MTDFERNTSEGVVHFKLTPEQIEFLRMLQTHPGWKLYSKLLADMRDKQLFSLMVAESGSYAKRIGMAEGLHLAAATLDHLVQMNDQRAKRVSGESKNQTEPNR